MSAHVLGCDLRQLVETEFMTLAPQVHLHFLTGEEEYAELGYGKVEFCCHGCGKAVLVYYTDTSSSRDKYVALRDEFARLHKKCPNINFENECPDYRSSHQVIDLRDGREGWKRQQKRHIPTSDKVPETKVLSHEEHESRKTVLG